MNTNSVDTPATAEISSCDNTAATQDYSRWMTNIAADIAHLKLHQLAIPGAHNSGVDLSGDFHIGKPWAACQNKSFPQQLAAGARYLDLRLVDSSYTKDIGGWMPRYEFKEVFEFKHGIVSVGRRLEHLVTAVRNFCTANPGEIVFIDFHHYDRGHVHSSTSLKRCLVYFNSISNRLIPPAARNLSIQEINKQYPGRNIILCLNHLTSEENWPSSVVKIDQVWSPLSHIWEENATEATVSSLVTESMTSPPLYPFWVLSAAVNDGILGIPRDLNANSPVRTEVFKRGFQNVNILMVDFIESSNSRVSVMDKCIALNRARGIDKSKPTAPANLSVKAVGEGKLPNTLQFTWTPSVDNLGVSHYQIYQNENFLVTTNRNPYHHKNFALRNYRFAIKAIDRVGNVSDMSNTFELVQDKTPPTTPSISAFTNVKANSATLLWHNSFDQAGVKGYEVYLDEQFVKFVDYSPTEIRSLEFDSLIQSKAYTVDIRAVDVNQLYSEYSTIILPPRPALTNPRVCIVDFDETTNIYDAVIIWETDLERTLPIECVAKVPAAWHVQTYDPSDTISFAFQATQGQEINHAAMVLYSRDSISPRYEFDFTFEAKRPEPIRNLKALSVGTAKATISWTPSSSSNVSSYAISINEKPPTVVPGSHSTLTFEEMPLDGKFLVEVWAINHVNLPSTLESITINAIDVNPPSRPTHLRAISITGKSATLEWVASSDNVAVTGYQIFRDTEKLDTINSTRFIASGLTEATDYIFKVRALDSAGNFADSDPLTVTTPAAPLPPPPPTNFSKRQQGSLWILKWDAAVRATNYRVLLRGMASGRTVESSPVEPTAEFSLSTTEGGYSVRIFAVNSSGESPPLVGEVILS